MKISVKHLHSANDLFLMSDKSYPRFEMVRTREKIGLSENQIGLLLPSTELNQKGTVFVGGEVRPNWKGNLIMEFHIWQPVTIRKEDIVGHLWVFEDEKPVEFEPAIESTQKTPGSKKLATLEDKISYLTEHVDKLTKEFLELEKKTERRGNWLKDEIRPIG